MRPVYDTNVLVDYLCGHAPAREELEKNPDSVISVITWIEVMVGAESEAEATELRHFLNRFRVRSVDESIAELAVELRRTHRLRVPDAIIWATAKAEGAVLVTRNTRDFDERLADIRVPYPSP